MQINFGQEAPWERVWKKNGNAQLALIAVITCNSLPNKIQTSSRLFAATLQLFSSTSSLHFLFPLCSTAQLLLYFTAIKAGNSNQVAQHEFLQGQKRSELLFNAVSFLSFSFLSFSLLFPCCCTQPWLFIVYDSFSSLSSRSIFLVGSAVLLLPCVVRNTHHRYSCLSRWLLHFHFQFSSAESASEKWHWFNIALACRNHRKLRRVVLKYLYSTFFALTFFFVRVQYVLKRWPHLLRTEGYWPIEVPQANYWGKQSSNYDK